MLCLILDPSAGHLAYNAIQEAGFSSPLGLGETFVSIQVWSKFVFSSSMILTKPQVKQNGPTFSLIYCFLFVCLVLFSEHPR